MSDYKKDHITCTDVFYVDTYYGQRTLQKLIKAYKDGRVSIHTCGSGCERDISEIIYSVGNVRKYECLDDNYKLSLVAEEIIHPLLYRFGYLIGMLSEVTNIFKSKPQQNLYESERQR